MTHTAAPLTPIFLDYLKQICSSEGLPNAEVYLSIPQAVPIYSEWWKRIVLGLYRRNLFPENIFNRIEPTEWYRNSLWTELCVKSEYGGKMYEQTLRFTDFVLLTSDIIQTLKDSTRTIAKAIRKKQTDATLP